MASYVDNSFRQAVMMNPAERTQQVRAFNPASPALRALFLLYLLWFSCKHVALSIYLSIYQCVCVRERDSISADNQQLSHQQEMESHPGTFLFLSFSLF